MQYKYDFYSLFIYKLIENKVCSPYRLLCLPFASMHVVVDTLAEVLVPKRYGYMFAERPWKCNPFSIQPMCDQILRWKRCNWTMQWNDLTHLKFTLLLYIVIWIINRQ